jgi:crossover junction endodeoxyribonuclease RuvC
VFEGRGDTRKGPFPGSRTLRVLGVDPGMTATGFGVVEVDANGSIRYCGSGVIRPQSRQAFSERLWKIFCDLRGQIDIFRPHILGVERPFYGKNVRSAMMLGQARGVAVLAGAEAGLSVQELSPLEVKQSVVGYGRASKEQVQAMVQALLKTPTKMAADAADALAVAICVGHSVRWRRCLEASVDPGTTGRGPCRPRGRDVAAGGDG